MNPVLMRALLAFGFALLGVGLYWLVNRIILSRASNKIPGLEKFRPGKPAILYFTMEGCVPCRTTQRPALEKLSSLMGDEVQMIEVDVVERQDLANSWGVLSVPTTFVIDPQGRPRRVNHGVTLAEKLLDQLEQVSGHRWVNSEGKDAVEIHATTSSMD